MSGQPVADQAPEHRARRRGRRGRTVAVAAVAVATVGAAVAASVGFGGGNGTRAAADLPPATATVTRQTLYDTESVDGELGFGPATSLNARRPGTITSVPYSGTVITRGGEIYTADSDPVVLMYGSVPAYRDLGPGTEGGDVKQLERNLEALGYTGFTVDDEYTWSTAEAVRDWQDKLGMPETGRVELGRVVFAPGAVRVDSVAASLGQQVGPGQKVLTYTGATRLVTVRLDVADQRLVKTGAKVQVEVPGAGRVRGTVQRLYTVIEEGDTPQDEAATKIEAIIALSEPDKVKGLDAAAVDVIFTASARENVLTVPVSALLALAEGGYGVEVVDGSTSRYVAVQTGLFADGRVEVSGNGITEGMTVGTPK